MAILLALIKTIVLILFLIFSRNIPNEKTKIITDFPLKLFIPAIGVSAHIQPLGVNSQGEMETPTNVIDAGWFKLGPKPGEAGSAVIAGHFNDQKGKPAIFANLDKLKIGDTIIVEDENKNTNIFTVNKIQLFDSGYAPEVFSSTEGNNLNLITCDGVWDKAKQSYSQRLVIFAH